MILTATSQQLHSEVTPEASNHAKKQNDRGKPWKVDLLSMTPLKAIGGHSIQNLTLDDLRMFCARNGIRNCKNASKVALCWAICKAREAYLAGEPAPYKNLLPSSDREEMINKSLEEW